MQVKVPQFFYAVETRVNQTKRATKRRATKRRATKRRATKQRSAADPAPVLATRTFSLLAFV
jgi:hypothetical protein